MPHTPPSPDDPTATHIERWLHELGLEPVERVERERVTSWDLRLDGLRRFDVRMTLIFDPAFALIAWVHFAPPIGDRFRASYRKLLHWNDEFPFAKFGLASDERPVLSAEVPIRLLDREELGLTIARLLTICDQLLEESAGWLWIGGRIPDHGDRVSRQIGLFARFADRLADLRPV
ncbi:MAG TPA: YbjN domain-containing protein [Candidatus Saccharimonadales bacterium]|nr:YbjN domain-containing protein [Candidatus Saccharimonadales bacterium]